MRWISILTALVVAAMSGGNPQNTEQAVHWSLYREGTMSQIGDSGVHAIRDYQTWNQYWRRLEGNGSNAPRDVDFRSEMLVGVHLGRRPNSGYDLEIRWVSLKRTGVIVIYARETTPAPGDITAQVITSPYKIIRVPRYAATPVVVWVTSQ